MEVAMLERFFLKPQTVDRAKGCWLGESIELYVIALCDQGYSTRSILRRVPILVQFADFTDARQIHTFDQAEGVIDAFVAHWLSSHCIGRTSDLRRRERNLACGTVHHFFSLAVQKSNHHRTRVPWDDPFAAEAPGFFAYLREERGLRPESIQQYRHHLRRFSA
jgi:hypothetical protein